MDTEKPTSCSDFIDWDVIAMGSCSNSPSVSSSALTPTHSLIIMRCYRALGTWIRFNFHQTDGDLYKSQTILNHDCALSYCIEQNTLLRVQVLTLVLLKIQIFWDVVQCWPLKTANILQEITASILSVFRELVGIAEILGPTTRCHIPKICNSQTYSSSIFGDIYGVQSHTFSSESQFTLRNLWP